MVRRLVREKHDFHVSKFGLDHRFRRLSGSAFGSMQHHCAGKAGGHRQQADPEPETELSSRHTCPPYESTCGDILPCPTGLHGRPSCSACFAADCSASFSLRPVPRPTTSPLTVTSTSNILS